MIKHILVGIPFEMDLDYDIVELLPNNPDLLSKITNFVVEQETKQEDGSIKISGTCTLHYYVRVESEYRFEGIIVPETRTGKFTSMKRR